MSDVRLTATNPDDSSVVPVACNAKGELLLEEPILVEGPQGPKGDKGDPGEPGRDGDPFTGNFEGNVSFTGAATFSEDVTINSVTVGRGAGESSGNTALGQSALLENTTGTHNTALGQAALQRNTTGISNVAIGRDCLRDNTEGFYNTAIGRDALLLNKTGNNNVAIGRAALKTNLSGLNNTAVGFGTLQSNTSGTGNIAVGRDSLRDNTEGIDNTAIGRNSLLLNETGTKNVAIGQDAARQVGGSNNTFIGSYRGASGLSDTLSLSTGITERMRIAANDAVDFNQKCGFTADGGLWITDSRGNKMRTTFSTGEFMQWETYEVVERNEPQLSEEELE